MERERYTELQKLCSDVETPPSAVGWDKCSTLVFREVRHCGGAVCLSPQHQFVDIKPNTQAVQSLLETPPSSDCDVLNLSWSGQTDSSCCLSTCTMRIHNDDSHKFNLVLNKLCEDGFKQLRQFAVMLFREFRCRLTKLRTPPIQFDFLHMDITEVEELQDNISVLERNFKNLFLDDIPNRISLQLHIHVAEAPDGSLEVMRNIQDQKEGINASHRLEDLGFQNRVRKGESILEDTTKLSLIQQLDRQLELEGDDIEATYLAQKQEVEDLMRDVRRVMQARRERRHQRVSMITRDAGDGAEVSSEDQSSVTSSALPYDQLQGTVEVASSTSLLKENREDVESYISGASGDGDVPQHQRSVNSSTEEVLNRISDPIPQLSLPSLPDDDSPLNIDITGLLQSSLVERSGIEETASGGSNWSRCDGMDTFICFAVSPILHTNESDIQEMKKIAFEFLQGLEELNSRHGIQENIGLVAKENSSWLKQKPTNDLKKVKKTIERVPLTGKASLKEAVHEAVAFVENTGESFKVTEDYVIGARLIIITNHTSLTHSLGSDFPLDGDVEEMHKLIRTLAPLDDEAIIIPVGVQADRRFLQELALKSKSDFVDGKDILSVCAHQHKWTVCAKMASWYQREFSCLSGDDNLDLKFLLDMFAPDVNGEDKMIIESRMKEVMQQHKLGIGTRGQSAVYSNLPPLGTRVVRGAGWQSQNQDTEGPGTIAHHNDRRSVVVEWDNGHVGRYLYGEGDVFEVKPTSDKPRKNTSDSVIDTGCEVIRGPDWDPSNTEDGGEGCVGIVYQSTHSGLMKVRWYKTDKTNLYRFGKDGKFEVLPRDFEEKRCEVPDTEEKIQTCETDTRKVSVDTVVWQWEDGAKWCPYTRPVSEKLEAAYTQRSDGSCLIKRDNKSYRVSFKEMVEKCLQDNSRRRIQRKGDGIQNHAEDKLSTEEALERTSESKPQATQLQLSRLPKNVPSLPKESVVPRQSTSLVERSRFEASESSCPRGEGMDTFICFSTSHILHKDDIDFQEMKKIALEFIQGLGDLTSKHGIQENIGLVAKGDTSWLKQKPTNDLKKVKQTIETITLQGKTSLAGAVHEAMTFLEETGKSFTMLEDVEPVGPRLIVLTNQRAEIRNSSHTSLAEDKYEARRLINTLSRLEEEATIIPVGGQVDRKFLRELTKGSNSEILEGKDISKAFRLQLKLRVCAKVASFYRDDTTCLSGDYKLDLKFLLEMFATALNDDEKAEIEVELGTAICEGKDWAGESPRQSKVNSNLPPLGSRVVRGAGWQSQNQDTEGPGTIVQHTEGGSVVVEWDNGHIGRYLYGEGDAFEVKVTSDKPRKNTSDSVIGTGCEVIRGPDWAPGNTEDGGDGCVGVVYQSHSAGVMKVRWYKTEQTNVYRFGKDGKYEVLPRDFEEKLEESSAKEEKIESSERLVDTVVWQWEDGDQWCPYSRPVSEKLEAAYTQRSDGSCLIKRDNKSYRVSFKEMVEKCLQDNSRRRIQRT